jgi:hypothetical protein
MPLTGLELLTPTREWPLTQALGRAATRTGNQHLENPVALTKQLNISVAYITYCGDKAC